MAGTDPHGPGVEFLDEPSDAHAGARVVAEAGAPTRQRLAIAASLGVLAAAVVIDVAAHHAPHRPAHPREVAVPVLPRPSLTEPCAPGQCGAVRSAPTAGVAQAFAATIPGSMTVSEHTATQRAVGGRLVVERRVIQAVSGNVEITLTIARSTDSPGAPGRHVTRLENHGYVFDFSFTGFYPPTRRQLRELSVDARLVSARA